MVLPAKRKAPAQPRRSTRSAAAAAASSSQNGTSAASAAVSSPPARGRSSSPRRRKRTRRTPAAAAAAAAPAASDNTHDEQETAQDTAADTTATNARASTAVGQEQDHEANAVGRAEFEAFQRVVNRDAAIAIAAEGNPIAGPAANLLQVASMIEFVDPDNVPPSYTRAIRQQDYDGLVRAIRQHNVHIDWDDHPWCRDEDDRYVRRGNSAIGEDDEEDEADSGNEDSMPQLEAAEPPRSPSRLVTCAICLEAFQPSSLVTLPCCAESEATSSTRFCPGCIAGLAHHEMIIYHVGEGHDEMAANYNKSTCVVGECPRCKRLLSVTNRNPPSYSSFEDDGCEFPPDQEHFSWTVDSIGLRLADVPMSVEYACRYAWRTNYGLGAMMDFLGFLSYLPFPDMILEQSLEYIHDNPSEVRRILTRLVQWGLLQTVRPGVYCLSDGQQAELREGRFRQLLVHPSGRMRPLGHRYFSHYAKFVPWEVDLDDMSTAAIRSFLSFCESLSNCAMATGYLLLTIPIPLLEFRIWRFVLLLRQTVVALAMSLGVVPGRVGPVSYPQQAVIFVVMATVFYLLWSIIKTTVWCGFVGCVAISVGRSLYSLQPPSRGGMGALFLLLHYYSDRRGSQIFALFLLSHCCIYQTLNPPLFVLYLYYGNMLGLGRDWIKMLSLRHLNSVGSPLVSTMAA